MNLDIKGKQAIVCASSKGLGRACAISLARNGVSVVINGRNEAALAATAQDIESFSDVSVTPVRADVSTLEGQRALLDACPDPDILINNNGGPPFKDFRELDREAMLAGLIMNMITPIELIQKVIDNMAKRKFGRIVNITSIAGHMIHPFAGSAYSISKTALSGLTREMANEFAELGVRVNAVAPGEIETDMIQPEYEMLIPRIPMGHMGSPKDVAKTISIHISG